MSEPLALEENTGKRGEHYPPPQMFEASDAAPGARNWELPHRAGLRKAAGEATPISSDRYVALRRVRLRALSFIETQGCNVTAGPFYQMSCVGELKFPSHMRPGSTAGIFYGATGGQVREQT